jgi:protein phosphatase
MADFANIAEEPVPPANTLNYTLAVAHACMNSKKRSTMEDIHRIVPSLGNQPEISYFAVYDGHGGRKIVDFIENTLEENIFNELNLDDGASIEERITR